MDTKISWLSYLHGFIWVFCYFLRYLTIEQSFQPKFYADTAEKAPEEK